MLEALKRLLLQYRAEGQEALHTPKFEDATFALTYGELVVGYLYLRGGAWEFNYSPEFKAQSQVQPLVDFPDLEKTYHAHALWPFFMARIPSLTQPQVKDVMAKEGLDENSDVALLRRFGNRSISNPFVLLEIAEGAA